MPSTAADTPSTVAQLATVGSLETIVLRIHLNSEAKGDYFVQRTADLDFFVKVEDLTAMGFRAPAGTTHLVDGEPHLSLRSVTGLTFSFEDKALALVLTAEPGLLRANSFAVRAARRKRPVVLSSDSAFFNYALSGSRSGFSGSGLAFAGEAGWHWGGTLGLTDVATVDTVSGKKLVRLMSNLSRDDRDNLRRFIVGDILTPSRDFSSSVNLGGVSVTKIYGIDPYYVRFPTQSLTGSVALPSDMEVYIDGQRVRTERLRPGEFELRDILASSGSRNVQVVLRDAFGRVQQLNYSLYFSDQPLQEGLHEYSYNFGAMRRDYGLSSNRYGPEAFTMYHRYGLNTATTLGWRAEATRKLINTGPTGTVVLGPWGVMNLGLTGSSIAGRHGHAALASYNFDSKDWAVGAFLRHDSRNYASLGDPVRITNRRYEGSVTASYRLPGYATVSLSHTALNTRAATSSPATQTQPYEVTALSHRRTTTLSYSQPLPAINAQLSASLSRINDSFGGKRNEAFLGLSFQLGRDFSGSTGVRGDGKTHSETLRFAKNQPVGEGLGYEISLDHARSTTESTQLRTNVQYNAPAAVLRAEYGHFVEQGQTVRDERISISGSVVAVGGHVAPSRPVTQSYAIVKVGELADIGVVVDGLPSGKTNARGIMVVPTLSAYYENGISIDSDGLPLEYALTTESQKVAPSLRSGALVDFGGTRTQAFSGRLSTMVHGVPAAAEFAEIDLKISGSSKKLATGRGGEFYVENLAPGGYKASVFLGPSLCAFELRIPQSTEMFVDLGAVLCVPAP